jgi:tetratricopeptide (TPR) repeat protein
MIVKNAEGDLQECLASAAGAVDEILVADTGSTDATQDIARSAGAKVIEIPWENDFAKARNQSLAAVNTDWVLVLDADERLDPDAIRELPAHLAAPRVAGYQVTIRNYQPSLACKIWDRPAEPNDSSYAAARQYPAYVDHENVRLFRREPEVYFTGRVHETVGHRIVELGRPLGTATFRIHHFGMVRNLEQAEAKANFYRELGLQKVAERPDDAQAHLEAGIAELGFGNLPEALFYFNRATALKPGFGVARFFAGKCEFQLGEYRRAAKQLQSAEASGHKTAAAAELLGDAHYSLAEYEKARECYRLAWKRSPESAAAESKLGLADVRSGRREAGLQKLRHAIAQEPANGELHDRLVTVEAWLNHVAAAAEAAEKKLACAVKRPEDFLRAASIRAQLREWNRASEILRDGLKTFPDSESLRTNLCKAETLSRAAR